MTESTRSRERRLAETFVALTDTLVTDFDVADLFHDLAGACVELLDVTAAGLMLVDVSGRLRVMSSSSERSRLLELMEIQNDEGPCLDCHREGAPVLVADLSAERARWPSFAATPALPTINWLRLHAPWSPANSAPTSCKKPPPTAAVPYRPDRAQPASHI